MPVAGVGFDKILLAIGKKFSRQRIVLKFDGELHIVAAPPLLKGFHVAVDPLALAVLQRTVYHEGDAVGMIDAVIADRQLPQTVLGVAHRSVVVQLAERDLPRIRQHFQQRRAQSIPLRRGEHGPLPAENQLRRGRIVDVDAMETQPGIVPFQPGMHPPAFVVTAQHLHRGGRGVAHQRLATPGGITFTVGQHIQAPVLAGQKMELTVVTGEMPAQSRDILMTRNGLIPQQVTRAKHGH